MGDRFFEEKKAKPVKLIAIAVCIIAICAALGYYLLTRGGRGPARILEITHSPQNPLPGEKITVTAIIDNASGFPHLEYTYYFAMGSGGGGGGIWDSVVDGKYTKQLRGSENGTEISCFVIAWDDAGNPTISDEHIIQVGHVEQSNMTSLRISSVNHDPPPKPGTATSIKAYAKVQSDAPPIDVEIIVVHFGKNGWSGGGGGGMISQTENEYWHYIRPPLSSEWSSGTTVMFKIVAIDDMGNTACSEWTTFTIS